MRNRKLSNMQRMWFIETKEGEEFKQQEAPREASFIEVAAEQTSDMRGTKRDWIFRVQVITSDLRFNLYKFL